MLTAEQIKNVTFASGFSGYKEAEVDQFLDECAETIEQLTQANDDMKRKMKVLADKLVEYRREENNIHSALMNAQRMGESVVREANQKASLILDSAQAKAAKMEDKIQSQIESKKQELIQVEKEVALFKDRLMALYKEHLEMIQALPEPEETPEEEPVKPEDTDLMPAEEISAEEATEKEDGVKCDENTVPQEDTVSAEELPLQELPQEEEPIEKVNSRFSDLQFGDDYSVTDSSRGFFKRKK